MHIHCLISDSGDEENLTVEAKGRGQQLCWKDLCISVTKSSRKGLVQSCSGVTPVSPVSLVLLFIGFLVLIFIETGTRRYDFIWINRTMEVLALGMVCSLKHLILKPTVPHPSRLGSRSTTGYS